ncbi:unnamed protein product [Prorocentrum cordatum]|uniref:RanBP2-type domain-containing protein n=1 Tax=Prorocentrum cordatum TaxID=2364126 RepID=A0ABN9SM33_9DINO|nr:unnamed protein product [Polarella glacialis]
MARSSRGGSSGERSGPCWMCSCGGWNWDWRSSCLSCGHAAPPWALGSAPAVAKPEADKGGWVGQPRGRKAQRQARNAAARAASAKSQTSASAASGAPCGGGVTAIERLQATAEQLEALLAGPPEGVDGSFAGVVASQLEAKRAELARAQQAAAEQKAATMPRSTLLHKEANAISKAEKRLRAARQDLEQKQVARDLAEAQLQKAQEELAELDGALEEASRALQVLEEAAREEAEARQRQRAAEWAGASQVPGLLTQLDKLPEAWASSNFEVAWAAIRAQMEAVRAQLAGPPLAPTQAPRAESCPMGEISSDDGNLAGGGSPWQPHAAAERGQAGRYGNALGEWPQVAQACERGLAAEAADLLGDSGAEVARLGSKRPNALGEAPAPPAPGRASAAARGASVRQAESALADMEAATAAAREKDEVGALGFGISEWSDLIGQAGVPGHPEATAVTADVLQSAELPPRMSARGLRAAAARRARAATGERCASPTDAVVGALEQFGWYLESERYMVADLFDEFDPMFLGPRALSIEASSDARQASNRYERRELCAYISGTHWTVRIWRVRRPVDGKFNGKLYPEGSAKDSEGLPPAGERRQVQAAAAAEPPLAGAALGVGPPAKRPRLEGSRSTGSSATALSATAVAFSILGHALSYACAGEGEDTQEIVACSKCGACKVMGSHAGAKPRPKERCPGDMTNKSGRNQRSLWGRGLHPGGRPQADNQRVKGEGVPALRSHGPVPGRAQERYLEWLGIEAESAGGASAAAGGSGSGPAAPAAVQAAEAAAASLPLQRPASTRAGLLGVHGTTEEEYTAAGSAAIDGQVSRRVRRRLAHRGPQSESE